MGTCQTTTWPPSASSTKATSRSSAATAARSGGQFEGFPLLLLTSTGAKSGAERVNLVGYFDIDDKIYVVGSAAGRDKSPAWVFNLRAHPDVQVEIGSDPAKAVVANELPRTNATEFSPSSKSAPRDSPNTRSAPIASSPSSNLPPRLNQIPPSEFVSAAHL